MVQWAGVIITLAEDPSSVSSIHMMAPNTHMVVPAWLLGDLMPYSGLMGTVPIYTHGGIHRQNMHKNKANV